MCVLCMVHDGYVGLADVAAAGSEAEAKLVG